MPKAWRWVLLSDREDDQGPNYRVFIIVISLQNS